MNLIPIPALPSRVFYPDSDGQPMADNTKQARWIVTLFGNLAALFRLRLDVFVAMDLLWYPVEGESKVSPAPDVLVVFGRPKGDRGSYKQWEEEDVSLSVVFEILSPGNTYIEMDDKRDFYDQHGVEEYYVYDPNTNRLLGFVRSGTAFLKVRPMSNHVSPRLGIRFDTTGPEMVVYGPDGKPFLTFEELKATQEKTEQLLSRVLELSRKARRGQATPEELAELDRLEGEGGS